MRFTNWGILFPQICESILQSEEVGSWTSYKPRLIAITIGFSVT